jgi:hypothetical protein
MLLGDGNVLGWHRSVSMDGAAVDCALMALEKWLYDEVETGRSISRWVRYIFERTESLARQDLLGENTL